MLQIIEYAVEILDTEWLMNSFVSLYDCFMTLIMDD